MGSLKINYRSIEARIETLLNNLIPKDVNARDYLPENYFSETGMNLQPLFKVNVIRIKRNNSDTIIGSFVPHNGRLYITTKNKTKHIATISRGGKLLTKKAAHRGRVKINNQGKITFILEPERISKKVVYVGLGLMAFALIYLIATNKNSSVPTNPTKITPNPDQPTAVVSPTPLQSISTPPPQVTDSLPPTLETFPPWNIDDMDPRDNKYANRTTIQGIVERVDPNIPLSTVLPELCEQAIIPSQFIDDSSGKVEYYYVNVRENVIA